MPRIFVINLTTGAQVTVTCPFSGFIVGLGLMASGGTTRISLVLTRDPSTTVTTMAATDGGLTQNLIGAASTSQLTTGIRYPVQAGDKLYLTASGGCQAIVLIT